MTSGAKRSIVHMIKGDSKVELFGSDVRTLCGLKGAPTEHAQNVYVLTDDRGNAFNASTRRRFATCQRCVHTLEKADNVRSRDGEDQVHVRGER